MWIVAYTWNGKSFVKEYLSYELALESYGMLTRTKKNPSIHYQHRSQI